jgi:hypothetical protein
VRAGRCDDCSSSFSRGLATRLPWIARATCLHPESQRRPIPSLRLALSWRTWLAITGEGSRRVFVRREEANHSPMRKSATRFRGPGVGLSRASSRWVDRAVPAVASLGLPASHTLWRKRQRGWAVGDEVNAIGAGVGRFEPGGHPSRELLDPALPAGSGIAGIPVSWSWLWPAELGPAPSEPEPGGHRAGTVRHAAALEPGR